VAIPTPRGAGEAGLIQRAEYVLDAVAQLTQDGVLGNLDIFQDDLPRGAE